MKLFFRANLLYVPNIKMQRRLKSRSVHNFSTREKRTAAQQNPIFPLLKHVFFPGSRHCASDLQTQVPMLCTDLNISLLYILILGTYGTFARKKYFLALSVCFQSPARALAAGLPRQDHVYKTTIESFRLHNKNSMKCVVNWIPLRNRVRSRNTQPHLKFPLVNWSCHRRIGLSTEIRMKLSN